MKNIFYCMCFTGILLLLTLIFMFNYVTHERIEQEKLIEKINVLSNKNENLKIENNILKREVENK